MLFKHHEDWSARRRASGELEAGLVVGDVAAIVKRTRIQEFPQNFSALPAKGQLHL
jgi:hypothetical protein